MKVIGIMSADALGHEGFTHHSVSVTLIFKNPKS